MAARLPRILLVEYNAGDVELMQEAFRECDLKAHLFIAHDGLEALEFLRKDGVYEDVPSPDFIILDLNLPKLNGREVLAFIKTSAELKQIPTIIFSTSNRRQDIEACYRLYANTYLIKPAQWDKFVACIRSLEMYWFNLAALPSL